jgi:hypothetical protein
VAVRVRAARVAAPLAPGRPAAPVTRYSEEGELEELVLTRCDELGLLVLDIPDSRRLGRYGRGYPDLTIASLYQVIWVELKSSGGELSRDQNRWKLALQASGNRWLLWRPADWRSGAVEAELGRLARFPR